MFLSQTSALHPFTAFHRPPSIKLVVVALVACIALAVLAVFMSQPSSPVANHAKQTAAVHADNPALQCSRIKGSVYLSCHSVNNVAGKPKAHEDNTTLQCDFSHGSKELRCHSVRNVAGRSTRRH